MSPFLQLPLNQPMTDTEDSIYVDIPRPRNRPAYLPIFREQVNFPLAAPCLKAWVYELDPYELKKHAVEIANLKMPQTHIPQPLDDQGLYDIPPNTAIFSRDTRLSTNPKDERLQFLYLGRDIMEDVAGEELGIMTRNADAILGERSQRKQGKGGTRFEQQVENVPNRAQSQAQGNRCINICYVHEKPKNITHVSDNCSCGISEKDKPLDVRKMLNEVIVPILCW